MSQQQQQQQHEVSHSTPSWQRSTLPTTRGLRTSTSTTSKTAHAPYAKVPPFFFLLFARALSLSSLCPHGNGGGVGVGSPSRYVNGYHRMDGYSNGRADVGSRKGVRPGLSFMPMGMQPVLSTSAGLGQHPSCASHSNRLPT